MPRTKELEMPNFLDDMQVILRGKRKNPIIRLVLQQDKMAMLNTLNDSIIFYYISGTGVDELAG